MTAERNRAKARAMILTAPRVATLALLGLLIAALMVHKAMAQDGDGIIRSHGYSFYGDLS